MWDLLFATIFIFSMHLFSCFRVLNRANEKEEETYKYYENNTYDANTSTTRKWLKLGWWFPKFYFFFVPDSTMAPRKQDLTMDPTSLLWLMKNGPVLQLPEDQLAFSQDEMKIKLPKSASRHQLKYLSNSHSAQLRFTRHTLKIRQLKALEVELTSGAVLTMETGDRTRRAPRYQHWNIRVVVNWQIALGQLPG